MQEPQFSRDLTEIKELTHNIAMQDLVNLIRFLINSEHPCYALIPILGLVLWLLLPIRCNISLGERTNNPDDKAS
jgi:hypothetical protein